MHQANAQTFRFGTARGVVRLLLMQVILYFRLVQLPELTVGGYQGLKVLLSVIDTHSCIKNNGLAAHFFKLPHRGIMMRSEEHTSELQSRGHLVCRLLLEKKKTEIL